MRFSFVEKVLQMSFVGQGYSQNLQDFIGASFKLHILLDNRNKAVGDDGAVDLYSDSVLRWTPKFLDLEVLIEPLEETLCA